MTYRDDLDRLLSAWLDDPYTPPAPHYLGRVLERTRHTRQRPAWASLERWLPMADKVLQPTTSPPLRAAWLLIIALLLVALVAGVAIVGSRLLIPSPVVPQGGAAVFAFSSIVGEADGDIYLARADGTDVRQLTGGPGIVTSPAWSPDGTRIAYRVWEGGNDSLVVIDAGGNNATTLATTPSSAAYCARGGPVWSPDGTNLIFPSNPVCESRFDLFIVPADGSSPATRLLAPDLEGLFADWSPDGKQIAFLGRDATGSVGLYVADAGPGDALRGGLAARRIFGLDGLDFPNLSGGSWWSPDGTELAVVSGAVATGDPTADTRNIIVVKPDGSEMRVVAENAFNPAWSPDGRRLAFHRTVDPSEYFEDRPCTARAWVVDADGTNERRLDPLVEGCAPPPIWSPDGTRLAGLLIMATPDDPNVAFHYGVMSVDGDDPEIALQDGGAGSWQPVVAPLPPAPSFEVASPAP
jgi:Tol biopolymer transport system component